MSRQEEVKVSQKALSAINNQQENLGSYLEFNFKTEGKSGKRMPCISLSNGTELSKENLEQFEEAFKRITGTNNPEQGLRLLYAMANGLNGNNLETRINSIASTMPLVQPRDSTEAMLLGQFLALQEAANKCLRQFNDQEGFYHTERFGILATKLFAQANATIQTLMKYRSGGQQVVQVVHLHNEGGKAIVAQNLSPPGEGLGKKSKNEPLG